MPNRKKQSKDKKIIQNSSKNITLPKELKEYTTQQVKNSGAIPWSDMIDTLDRCNQNLLKDLNRQKDRVAFLQKENENLNKTYDCLQNQCSIQKELIELLKIKNFKDNLYWHEFKVNDDMIIYLKIGYADVDD